MSFKLFIYYCAVCGGWAAFVAWCLVAFVRKFLIGNSPDPSQDHSYLITLVTSSLLGLLVAGAVGGVDAFLNGATRQQRMVRVLICLGVGILGSLVASIVIQALVGLLPYPTVVWILVLLGWILVGVAIGASVGIYDILLAKKEKQPLRGAMRKTLNGITGGALGGLAGGILYQVLHSESLPRFSLALGLAILGACIGLLIGLAQVILKEAWVKVEAGFRAGRELMLSKAETTIGRSETCDIGLFGDTSIEKTHARIVLEGQRYLLADAGGSTGTFLNEVAVKQPMPLRNGDAIRIGNSTLRFGEKRKQPARS